MLLIPQSLNSLLLKQQLIHPKLLTAALARMNAGLTDITALNQSAIPQAITSEILSIQNYNIRLSNLYRETAIWPQDAEGVADQLLDKTDWTKIN